METEKINSLGHFKHWAAQQLKQRAMHGSCEQSKKKEGTTTGEHELQMYWGKDEYRKDWSFLGEIILVGSQL
jgi:hypothetical protein